MAKRARGPSARPVQIGEQIRQCLSEMLQQGAVKDPRLTEAPMVTVTEVRMTNDLRLGRVLVSVFPDDEATLRPVFEALGAQKYAIKKEVSRRLRLRFTPELRFLVDDSMAYGQKIEALLREINADDAARGGDTESHADADADATDPDSED